jgi:hypothetical protein
MVKNKPTTRKLSVRKQWQAKIAMEQLEKRKFIEFGTALVAMAVMLAVLGSVALEKASKIDEGQNLLIPICC